ncbi:RNase P/RNase MRP subunit p30 [Halanaeroarchaeum sp. HSR-CO]|uniref:RNase P subunit p30 family protein n=1 Tax=Halanaeroarchaeum sp. HSR-CO TaxID=2866382 RepID=UPI00217E74E6|nr:RNase P subunit p30 family protein [Halanaeroarchaeum sp. HSR-CO]UWG48369.1 RNase P/RNase MRP subunit p30 [Halanaeroarchaeum sp. HSR-CO]
MYEAVRVEAEGRTTTARFAATAADAGFDGIVVADRYDDPAPFDADRLRAAYGIDVVDGFEVRTTEKGVASGVIADRRRKTTVLMLRGGTPTMNRYAVETPAIDVLRDPLRGDGDVNHVIVKAAARNDVHIEVNLGPVLRTSGGPRVQALRGLRKLRELLDHFDAPFVVSGGPETHLQVRGPRELLALGQQLGFDEDQIRSGLEAWGDIATTNRERLSEEYVAEGVRRGRYER